MFKGNRIVRVVRWKPGQDPSGNNVVSIAAFWNKWADVTDRFGNSGIQPQQQEVWTYEQRIKMRYEVTRPTQSNDYIEYDKGIYRITGITRNNEAFSEFETCYVVKADFEISNLPPMNIDNITVLNYYGVNGENQFTDDDLVGKNYFGAFLDGVEYEIIPNELTGATVPTGKQVYINVTTGATTWSMPILAGTHAMIQMYGSQ